jgi:hypothetical protein
LPGWHGGINGRIPLLHHRRALIMTPTIFGKNAYDDGIRDAIPDLVKQYFQQACQLGRDFGRPAESARKPPRPPDHPSGPVVALIGTRPAKNASRRPGQDADRMNNAARSPGCALAGTRGRRSFERGHRPLVPPKAATDPG